MENPVIVSGARTPIGKFLGSLSHLSSVELGAHAAKGALERAQVSPKELDAVLFGNVVQAGGGPNVARLVAHRAGIPLSVPGMTLNKLCLSGLATLTVADMGIRSGNWSAVLTGGTESMSNIPHLSLSSRKGNKFGGFYLEDALEYDALVCGIDKEIMGAGTERHQQPFNLARSDLDEIALRSHLRAANAQQSGYFDEEIVPISVSSGGTTTAVSADEGIRPDSTIEGLAALRPAFRSDGLLTAGSSSQISDGAASLIVMSKQRARELEVEWLAEIVSHGSVAGPEPSLLEQPAKALNEALAKQHDISLSDLSTIEINEAFASVVLVSARALNVSLDIVNPNGGAISLGHPVGMSGARLVLSAIHELRRQGGGYGAATLCGGGGQGEALIVKVD